MNTKILFRILIACALYGVFAGYVLYFYEDNPENMSWGERQAYNKQVINKLELNDNRIDTILKKLGSPDITEATKLNNDNYQVMFYRTQHVKSDGLTSKDECTALLFKNSELIAIGETAIDRFQNFVKQLPAS